MCVANAGNAQVSFGFGMGSSCYGITRDQENVH